MNTLRDTTLLIGVAALCLTGLCLGMTLSDLAQHWHEPKVQTISIAIMPNDEQPTRKSWSEVNLDPNGQGAIVVEDSTGKTYATIYIRVPLWGLKDFANDRKGQK